MYAYMCLRDYYNIILAAKSMFILRRYFFSCPQCATTPLLPLKLPSHGRNNKSKKRIAEEAEEEEESARQRADRER